MAEVLKKDQSFKGFETWFTSGKMRLKMYLIIGLAFLAVQIFFTFIFSYVFYRGLWNLALGFGVESIFNGDFGNITYIFSALKKLTLKSLIFFIPSFLIWFFFPAALAFFKARAEKQSADTHIRGSKLLTEEDLKQELKKEECDLPFGTKIQLPRVAEPRHIFIIGKPGSGKTVALSQIIERLRERNEKTIIYDFKGDFVAKFFDSRKDFLFNPLDSRCLGWSVFNEVHTYMDIDAVAHSLIPPSASSSDPFWNDGARDVFAGILHHLWQTGKTRNGDIWDAVSAPAAEIAGWLQNTKGGERGLRYVEDASGKQALSILAVMMQYCKAFEFMSSADGDFSIKKWLENEEKGFIFVTNYADIKDTLRPILSLFVDLFGRKLLSLGDNLERRVFFLLDEFGTLQRLSTIVNLLTLSRSKGGSVWIGIQDIGQLDNLYSPQTRNTIINACGNNLIFSLADPDSARILSDKIGDMEIYEVEENFSMGPDDHRDGLSLSRKKKITKILLPAEIAGLPDLTAIAKIANYDYAKVIFEFKKFSERSEPFMMRPEFMLEKFSNPAKKTETKIFEERGKELAEIEINF